MMIAHGPGGFMNRRAFWLALIAALACAAGCTTEGDPLFAGVDAGTVSTDGLIGNCSPCHVNGGTSGQLSLDSFEDLMAGGESGSVVEACSPSTSLLFDKVANETPTKGSRMPLGSALSQDLIDVIERWITEGATSSPDAAACSGGGVPADAAGSSD